MFACLNGESTGRSICKPQCILIMQHFRLVRSGTKSEARAQQTAAFKINNSDAIEQDLNSVEESGAYSINGISCILQKSILDHNQSCALHVYAYLKNHGLETHPQLGNALVSSLAEFGCMSDARHVFDQLEHRDQSSWNSLITGYIRCGKLGRALSIYQRIHHDDYVHLNPYNFVSLLKACVKLKDVTTGRQLHVHAAQMGLIEQHTNLGITLISMYAKCGCLRESQEVFDELSVRDVVHWTALISGYTDHGNGEKALKYFKHMQLEGIIPNAVTYICCLKACADISALEKGKEIHCMIAKCGTLEREMLVGTALVGMYCKCGLLAKAQEVFDRLSSQNTVSWNALIMGYAQHGHNEDAVRCYDKMQQGGVTPNVITYVSVLKACAAMGSAYKGQEVRQDIVRKGHSESDPVIGTALINMYTKCGLCGKAQEVFNRLSSRDVVSWTALIAGYVETDRSADALACYHEMQLDGVHPDAYTFICVLKACSSERSLHEGEAIHLKIAQQGSLAMSTVVGTALIEMYAKCGAFDRAQEVLENLAARDVVSWNALMAGYDLYRCDDDILNCMDRMELDGLSPDEVSFVYSLKACGTVGRLEKGHEIHLRISKRGPLERNAVVGCALVDMYAKCGLVGAAQEVFDELSVRDVISWTALIGGYAQHGHGDQALKCFEWMQVEGVSANAITYLCLLEACADIGALNVGQGIHAEICRGGLMEEDHVIGTGLVDMYAKCGFLARAHEVFDELPCRDVILWSTLITGYITDGRCVEALNCFDQMQLEGVSPDEITFVCALKACAFVDDIEKGEVIHAEVSSNGILGSSILVGNALVDMYARCGLLSKAQNVFDNLPFRVVSSWTSLIAGYAEYGQGEFALVLFEKMQLDGVCPDAEAYLNILVACASMGAVQKGQQIHEKLSTNMLSEIDLLVGTALVDMYGKFGLQSEAHKVFDQQPVRDVVLWSTLIAGYAQLGKSEKVLHIIGEMLDDCVAPNFATFVGVLNACSHTGLVHEGQTYFITMSRDYKILFTHEHYTCIVDLLSRAGQLDIAILIVNLVPFHIDSVLWHTLLAACQKWGSMDRGRQIFDRAVQAVTLGIESALYVLMSNTCLENKDVS